MAAGPRLERNRPLGQPAQGGDQGGHQDRRRSPEAGQRVAGEPQPAGPLAAARSPPAGGPGPAPSPVRQPPPSQFAGRRPSAPGPARGRPARRSSRPARCQGRLRRRLEVPRPRRARQRPGPIRRWRPRSARWRPPATAAAVRARRPRRARDLAAWARAARTRARTTAPTIVGRLSGEHQPCPAQDDHRERIRAWIGMANRRLSIRARAHPAWSGRRTGERASGSRIDGCDYLGEPAG